MRVWFPLALIAAIGFLVCGASAQTPPPYAVAPPATSAPPDDSKTFTIGGHGDSKGILDASKNQFLSARELTSMISNDQRFASAEKIVLYSCSTGEGKNPLAQKLANSLNKPVIAPTSTLWMRPDGSSFVAPVKNPDAPLSKQVPDMNKLGSMKTFLPEKKER